MTSKDFDYALRRALGNELFVIYRRAGVPRPTLLQYAATQLFKENRPEESWMKTLRQAIYDLDEHGLFQFEDFDDE